MTELSRVILVDGDLPLTPGEVAINDRLAERRGASVGDALTVALFPRDDLDRVANGQIVEPLEEVELRIGALIRTPFDLVRSPQAQPGTIYESDEGRLVLEPSFWADHGGEVAFYGLGSSLSLPGPNREERLAAMADTGGDHALVSPLGSDDLAKLEPVGDAIDLQANALLALAAVVLVFGLAVLGGATVRATREDDTARESLLALGLTGRQVARVALLRGVGVTAVATVLAVAGAVAMSPAFPIGLARDAELDPGVSVDLLVLVPGGLLFAALLTARLLLGTWTDRAVESSPPAPPSQVPLTPTGLGARLVTDGLGRRGNAPARVAMATAVAGVAAVVGAATFAASLDHLAATPELQGWTWDVVVGNYSDADAAEAGRRALEGNADVAAFSAYQWATLQVDDLDVPLAYLEAGSADFTPTVLDGRAPTGGDEIALGRDTLAQLGKAVGDRVEVRATGAPVEATVVGTVVAPATIAFPMDLDSGGTITFAVARRIFADQPGSGTPAGYLVSLRADVDRRAALKQLREDFPGTVLGPMEPLDLADLQRVRTVPYLLAALLGGLALISTIVSLASSGRRRRREVAVLRALGLARPQLRRLVAGEATTFLALGLAAGIPLGIAGGRLAWSLAADGLGSEVGPLVPLLTVTAATLALLVVVNLYGQALATLVARRHPGQDLHTE
jgi:NADH:ubiquinone oxidoreductase subunit 6 (subunit J)